MIQDVVHVSSNRESHAFTDVKSFTKPSIEALETGTVQAIPANVTERIDGRQRICRRVEVLLQGAVRRRRITNQIGAKTEVFSCQRVVGEGSAVNGWCEGITVLNHKSS